MDSYAGPCKKPAGAHRGSSALVPSTLQGLNALTLVRKRCREKEYERHLATRRVRAWALESVDIGLSRAAFVPLTLFLSSMRHHQVLCVLSVCCLRFISLGFPSKPVAP